MGKKNNQRQGVVYSTDPLYSFSSPARVEVPTPDPDRQKLRVLIDRKQRGGKEVTLVTGFIGTKEDREELGKLLKNKCGTGGSVKDDEILVQGNQRDKVIKILLEMGYSGTKAAGG